MGEAASRALATVRQVMPTRLRHRLDSLQATVTAVRPGGGQTQTDPAVLVTLADAVRSREVLRFDYAPADSAARDADTGADPLPPRRVEPHHVVSRHGRWYLLAWDLDRNDWRTYRVDRITPRTPTGPRFTRREIPGGDVAAFIAALFKGSRSSDTWPCRGQVILHAPASSVAPFIGDGTLEAPGPNRCQLTTGSWSWAGLTASIARYDLNFEVLDPPPLREAFATLARRCSTAAEPSAAAGPDETDPEP